MNTKINHLKTFINLSLRSTEYLKASKNLAMAQSLMKEVESTLLANPFLADHEISDMVTLTRSPLWSQAESHVNALHNNEMKIGLAA